MIKTFQCNGYLTVTGRYVAIIKIICIKILAIHPMLLYFRYLLQGYFTTVI